MAHPIQLLEKVKRTMPELTVQHWIFGLFNTSCPNLPGGMKGLLGAGNGQLIFCPGKSGSGDSILVFPTDEIESVTSKLTGTISISCYLKGGSYIEMSYISRGNLQEFLVFLESDSGNLTENILS